MSRRDLSLLLALSGLWGASFMFIKVGVEAFGPVGLVSLRVILGALGLGLIARLRGLAPAEFLPRASGVPALRGGWFAYLLVALLATTLPFLLIAWGEQYIASGNAGILNATAPLFAALLAPWWPVRGRERIVPGQLAGLAVGFGGVALLFAGAGGESEGADRLHVLLGELAVLGASVSYALGGLFTRQAFAGRNSLVPALGQTTVAAVLMLVPFVLWERPERVPEWNVIASVLTLGLAGTAVAYVFFYELIRSVGAPGALSVTYLASGMSVVYGALLLDEPVTAAAVGGLVLIITGIAMTARRRAGGRAFEPRTTGDGRRGVRTPLASAPASPARPRGRPSGPP